MALKLSHPASAALDISISVKGNSYNTCSVKNTRIISVGSFLPCTNSCSLKRIATPPVAASKTESGVSEGSPDESVSTESSVQSQLDLLERLTSKNSIKENDQGVVSSTKTIREQLSALVDDEVNEVTIPLGKRFKPNNYNSLTISQKRNIKRQDYLNKVARRNDIPFFSSIALFVLLPPLVILGVAVATGYVDLFP